MKRIVKEIDAILNQVTMYRMLAYGLSVLAGISVASSLLGEISLKTSAMLASLFILVAVSYGANKVISSFWNVAANNESWYITALILFFILPPATTTERAIYIGLAALIAIASKFLVAINGKHIFNPAAFGVFVIGIAGFMHTSWWIGSAALWPAALMYGLFVTRKIRKFQLLGSFVAVSLIVTIVVAILDGSSIASALDFMVTTSPLIFLGTIMLTEPSTMPARRNQQLLFGALVGALYAWHPLIGPLFIYPETALLIGNVYAFALSPKQRVVLRLKKIDDVSDNVKDYIFEVKNRVDFLPGQYSEWTLGHKKTDGRGNRRTFTIASSPTEKDIHIGVKFYDKSSSFKHALRNMKIGDTLLGGTIAGDFVLPNDQTEKITMIAGGIGITPFRSMLKYVIDTKQKRDIVLFYLVSDPLEITYKEILLEAARHKIKIVRVCSAAVEGFETRLDNELLARITPDFAERTTYISGPNAMVTTYEQLLHGFGTKRIITDHFSGY